MVNFELQKAKKKIRQAIDGKYAQKTTTTVAAAVGTRHVAIDGNLASATLPDGSSGAVEVVNAGRLASARYELRTGGTVSVVSGGGGGSGGGSGISFSEADTRYYTKSQLDIGQLDIRYYTEAELDAGALDTRYFTESESDARFVPLTRTVTGSGALGGGGALSANQAITMNTPGSLTATSINASATNHTHAIDSTIARSAITIGVSGLGLSGGGNLTANRTITLTSSSNPGAASSILASTAAGGLTLATLTTTGAISGAANTNTAHLLGYATVGYVGYGAYAAFAANTFADLTNYALLQSDTNGITYLNTATGQAIYHRVGNATVMVMDANGLDFESGKLVGSSGYVSGWAGSGWRADHNLSISGQSFAEFDNLSIRGTLSVYELVINQIRATNGTLIVSSAGKIDSVSGSNWTFEDPNASNLCAFAVNDIVIVQSVDVNASTIVKRIVRQVSAVSGKTITVTTAAGAPVDTGSAVAGDTVVRIGNTSNAARQGVVLITSDMSNSPYQDVISGVASWADWTGGTKTRVRLGHLSGITGTANEYGLLAGNGYTLSDSYLKLSTSGVVLNKVDSTWRNGTTLTVNIQSDGDIFAGSNIGAVATTSFAHFAVAQTYSSEAMGAGDIVIGNKAAGHMFWDASAGTLNFRNNTIVQAYVNTSGEIVAGSGNVVMNDSALTVGGNVTMNGSGLTLPVQSYSTEPSPTGGLLSNTDPKRIHQGNLELASYTVDFDPLTGKRTGATIRHVAPSVTDLLSGGFSYTGSFSKLLIESMGYYGATAKYAYIDMRAGNDNNISRSYINIVATDYVQIGAPLITYNPITITGVGQAIKLVASAAGSTAATYMSFFDSNDVRKGFVGDSSTSNSDIYLYSDTAGVKLGTATNADTLVVSGGSTLVNQSSTTLADAALKVFQADASEEFVDWQGAVGAGNAIDTAALGTYYGKIRVAVNGTFKFMALYNT